MIHAIASQQITALRRQKIFLAILGLFMTMTAIAGILGWSSHNTIARVYVEAAKLLASTGQPAPNNPFLSKPTLSLLSNMVVYVPFLGALLGLVLGHLGMADDEADGLGRLIFSRPVSRRMYVAGKVVAAGLVLAVVLGAAFVISVISLLIVNQAVPALGDLVRLGAFYGLSWVYLLAFALIGMVAVMATRRRSLALLSAMGAWLVITFAIPQFTSGLRPTASLNPIVDPVSTSQPFFQVTALARPFSVAEQYKEVSGRILAISPAESAWHTTGRLVPIVGLLAVLLILVVALADRHDFSRSSSSE